MAKSSNGYVPKGLHHNKVWNAKHRMAPIGDASPQYHVTLGRSRNTTTAEIETTKPRRGAMVLSPRQARKQARLIALANTVAANRALVDRQRAADRATINAARGSIAHDRTAKRATKVAGMVEAEINRRNQADDMSWFIGQLTKAGL